MEPTLSVNTAHLGTTPLWFDLVAVPLSDPREQEVPPVGLLELEDAETGGRFLLDTSNREVRAAYAQAARERRERLRRLAKAARVDLIEVSTDGGHLDALIRFFRLRERRLRRR